MSQYGFGCAFLLVIAVGCSDASDKGSGTGTAGNTLVVDPGSQATPSLKQDQDAADEPAPAKVGGPKLIAPSVNATASTDEKEPTHVLVEAAEYYTTGPQQGRPPDGNFAAGTKAVILEEAGSYARIRTADGIEAFVTADVLKPIGDDSATTKAD